MSISIFLFLGEGIIVVDTGGEQSLHLCHVLTLNVLFSHLTAIEPATIL